MRVTLSLHPESHRPGIERIEVEVGRPTPQLLELRYRLIGTLANVVLPPLMPPTRGEGLWQHSCLEAFVRATRDSDYREFNFAPSSRWAAYRFDGYRDGMRDADPEALHIHVSAGPERFELIARVAVDLPAVPWQLGLSAVIEATDGRKSHWALAHPPGRPDFHHRDSFALELAAETIA